MPAALRFGGEVDAIDPGLVVVHVWKRSDGLDGIVELKSACERIWVRDEIGYR